MVVADVDVELDRLHAERGRRVVLEVNSLGLGFAHAVSLRCIAGLQRPSAVPLWHASALISQRKSLACDLRSLFHVRVLVVDESRERADVVRDGLRRAGYEVTASLSSPLTLLKTIEELKPDVIVIDTDSPSRDVLEHLVVMTQHTPRPVVMFASDDAPETIREAVRAGVSAYVVD
ncbi:MAG: response regulator, partial [Betaproteobacteria bacterium]